MSLKRFFCNTKGLIYHYIDNTIHKFWVSYYLSKFILNFKTDKKTAIKLLRRSIVHDLSKYSWSEAKHFMKVVCCMKNHTYLGEEYQRDLEILKPALAHHYERNSHHPQFYDGTVSQMSQLDQIEMLCDWLASVRKHSDGNIFKSIEANQDRFKYDDKTKRAYRVIVTTIL